MLSYCIREYLTVDGGSPFDEWLQGLRDPRVRARIRTRLDRASLGNLGDCASVGEGVFELRLFHGPGYRVYYGLHDATVLVLLYGGVKGSQRRDIRTAKAYWSDYRRREIGNQQKV